MKTICTDIDGVDKPIAEAIRNNLGAEYSYTYRIINFKTMELAPAVQERLLLA